MFNTIKSRITIILTLVTVVFFVVVLISVLDYFKEASNLITDSYDNEIAAIAQQLNKNIITVEHNASDLAVVGNSYANHRLNNQTLIQYLISNLEHYKEPIAVGLWYEPYKYDPKVKYHAVYGVRQRDGSIVFKDIYSTPGYNYLGKQWYTNVISKFKPNNVVWTLAYGQESGYQLIITAAAGIYIDGELVGMSTVDWDFDACVDIMSKVKPTPNTFTLFADKKQDFVYFITDPTMDSKQAVGAPLQDISWYNDNLKDRVPFKYNGIEYIPFIEMLDNGMMLIVNVPTMEILGAMYAKVFILLIIMSLLSGSLISLLYYILNNDVLRPINKLISIAKKISSGEEGTEIKIEKPVEFALLASTYDKMTSNIKQITQNQTKMNYELSVANSIQISSLPNVFPPFPEHKEFSIFASMEPAKEVGGDFYDFYFKDRENLMFLVADVSGKGVPAALFMMTVKTLINNLSPTIPNPKDLIEKINKKVCENNKEGFFVTMFASIVNIRTGKMHCINCGHNPPLIRRNGGKFEYLKINPNLALGIIDKIDYEIYETTLNTGDSIFVYTDGITEAINTKEEMYGEKRLVDCLNGMEDNVTIEKIIKNVKANVKEFEQGQIQSDDMTMLLFQYFKTIRIFERPAIRENYKEFKEWLHKTANEWNIDAELSNKIDMCGEEIFANICFYAYPYKVGNMTVSLEKTEKELIMTFEDNGIIYNPLEKPDPDLDTDPKERPLGGLGIYMVKQMANEIKYERVKNKNILSLKFGI